MKAKFSGCLCSTSLCCEGVFVESWPVLKVEQLFSVCMSVGLHVILGTCFVNVFFYNISVSINVCCVIFDVSVFANKSRKSFEHVSVHQ